MWGFTIYLMRLAEYLQGRKYRKKLEEGRKEIVCRVCGNNFNKQEELDKHVTTKHSSMI